jgi:RND family efflux transporter MFP subunit
MKSARLFRSFLLALGVTLSAVSCKPQSAGGPPAMPPPTGVTVANPIAKELFDWEELTGRLDAVKTVEIRPRVSGHIASITFTPGQLVKKGDVLFTIDRRPAKALYDQATANAERAEALAGNAAREARRADELLAAKAISSEEGETRRAKLAEATATAKAAQAAKAAAALEYEFTEVISPIDGRVSRELVAEGNFVSGVAGFTTLLTTVVSVDEVYGYADMDEAAFLRISKLLAEKKLPTDEKGRAVVELQLMDESGYPRKGYFESLDNRITAATGGIVLRAVFPNTDGRLIPGLYARMRLPGSAKYQALVISEDAIQTNQNLKFVYVVDAKSTAQIRPVKVGTSTDGQRIIREGLTTADRVIVNGAKKVIPTFPVAPMSEPVAANP